MFAFANVLDATAQLLGYALHLYMWIIIIRALLSWVNPDPYNPIVRFLVQVTEPVLYQVRKRIPFMGGLDLSPIIVIFIIYFLQIAVVRTISDFAMTMR